MRSKDLTTLIYITSGDKCLFIRKTREDDLNYAKYLGIGGHFESGESPEDCIIRELGEETGLTMDDLDLFSFRGLVTFVNDTYGNEYMHVFTAELKNKEKELSSCDEGELVWVSMDKINALPIWEGDKKMFDLLFKGEKRFFTLKLTYTGDKLLDSSSCIYM